MNCPHCNQPLPPNPRSFVQVPIVALPPVPPEPVIEVIDMESWLRAHPDSVMVLP